MPKNMNVENTTPVEKSTKSPGTRGESAHARNFSGNHFSNRIGTDRRRGVKATRKPKSY